MDDEGPYTYSAAALKLPETDLTRRGILHANRMEGSGWHTTGTVLSGLVAEVERLREINSELVRAHNTMLVHKEDRTVDPRYRGLLFVDEKGEPHRYSGLLFVEEDGSVRLPTTRDL
jgi:hypothetical protein